MTSVLEKLWSFCLPHCPTFCQNLLAETCWILSGSSRINLYSQYTELASYVLQLWDAFSTNVKACIYHQQIKTCLPTKHKTIFSPTSCTSTYIFSTTCHNKTQIYEWDTCEIQFFAQINISFSAFHVRLLKEVSKFIPGK